MNALYLYLYITVSLPLRYCISLTLIFALYQSAYFSLCLSLLLQFYTICCLLSSLQSGTLLNYINQSNGVLRLFAALAEGCEIFKNEGASVGKSSSLLSFDLYVMTSNVGANDVRCLTEERTITFVLYSLHSSRYASSSSSTPFTMPHPHLPLLSTFSAVQRKERSLPSKEYAVSSDTQQMMLLCGFQDAGIAKDYRDILLSFYVCVSL